MDAVVDDFGNVAELAGSVAVVEGTVTDVTETLAVEHSAAEESCDAVVVDSCDAVA